MSGNSKTPGKSKNSNIKNPRSKRRDATDENMMVNEFTSISPEDARKQTIIGVIAVFTIVALIAGIVTWRVITSRQNSETVATSKDSAYTAMNASDTVKPSDYVSKDGAIVITKRGIIKNPDSSLTASEKKLRQVDTYIDLNCPGCGAVDRSLNQYYQGYLSNDKIVLRIHPIAFLDGVSTDDYSTRAANSVYRLLDYAPDKIYDYVTYLLSDGVEPGEGSDYKSFTDKDLQKAAVKIGVDSNDASHITDKKYSTYVKNVTTYAINDKNLWKANATSFSTPVLLVDGKQLTFDTSGAFVDQFVKLIG